MVEIGLDSPGSAEIADQSLGINWPAFWTLIADKDILFPGSFPERHRGGYNAPKLRQPYPRLGPRKRVARTGGGLATISPGFPGPCGAIVGDSRAPLYGPYSRLRLAYFMIHPRRAMGRLKCAKIGESLAAIRARQEGRLDWWVIGYNFHMGVWK